MLENPTGFIVEEGEEVASLWGGASPVTRIPHQSPTGQTRLQSPGQPFSPPAQVISQVSLSVTQTPGDPTLVFIPPPSTPGRQPRVPTCHLHNHREGHLSSLTAIGSHKTGANSAWGSLLITGGGRTPGSASTPGLASQPWGPLPHFPLDQGGCSGLSLWLQEDLPGGDI